MLLPEGVARAQGVEGFIVIAIIYAILTVVGKFKQAAKRSPPAPPARRSAPPISAQARRLEELLRGLTQSREGATENTESLEVDREPVDQDSGAEAVAQRRIEAAMARNRPLTDQDHAEFEKRSKPAEMQQPVARRTIGRNRLRHAIIWREILGPPLALRDIEGREA